MHSYKCGRILDYNLDPICLETNWTPFECFCKLFGSHILDNANVFLTLKLSWLEANWMQVEIFVSFS